MSNFLKKSALFEPKYRLRWRFDFLNKAPKIGIWNGNGREEDGAWRISKDGLVLASIEGESLETCEIKTFLDIPGHLYVSAEWEAYSKSPWRPQQDIKLITFIAGLTFITPVERLIVFVDGSISRKVLPEYQKYIKEKTEHKLGVG
jgi:hypothetical protein